MFQLNFLKVGGSPETEVESLEVVSAFLSWAEFIPKSLFEPPGLRVFEKLQGRLREVLKAGDPSVEPGTDQKSPGRKWLEAWEETIKEHTLKENSLFVN